MNRIALITVLGIALVFGLLGWIGGCVAQKAVSPQTTPVPGSIEQSVSGLLDVQATKALWTPTMYIASTPEPNTLVDAAATIAWAGISAGMTQQAAGYAAQNAQATQTQLAQWAESTRYAQATKTAEAWRVEYWQATQTAAVAQTAEARPLLQTQQAWTQEAIPGIATANAGRMYAQATIDAGQALQVDMATKKEKWAGIGNAVVPWVTITAGLALLYLVAMGMMRFRKMAPDGQTYMVDDGKGKKLIVNTSRMSTPVQDLKDGTPKGMVNEEFQREVTGRAQKVAALQAAPVQAPVNSINQVSRLMASQLPSYGVDEHPQVLTSDEQAALDKEWKE